MKKYIVNSLYRHILLMCTAVLVSACSDDVYLNQPAELTQFKSAKYLDVVWHGSTGAGVEEQYVFLQPLVLKNSIVTTSRKGVVKVINLKTNEFDDEVELDLDSTISAGVGGNEKVWLLATRDAHVIAIDAKNRQELWRSRVSSEVLARPVIYNDTAIVRTVDGKILSLDLSNGNIRWQYQRAIPDLTLRGSSEIVVARDKIFAGLADGRLVAISPDNGEVVWDIALAVPKGRSEIQRLVDIDGSAELYGRVLYVASFQGRVAAVDVEQGRFLWARDFSTQTGIALDDKTLYSSDDKGHIWAVDRLNGATLWKQEKLEYRKLTRPSVVGDYIVVADYEGYVHFLSRYDGHFVARYQLGQFDHLGWERATGIIIPPIALPTIENENRVLIVTRGGIAYLLALRELEATAY